MGDTTKGGRPMTEEERANFIFPRLGEIPKGLEKCSNCGLYWGYCVDPSPYNNNLVVFVICHCRQASCTRCGKLLKFQPISNYYNEKDGQIWHVPWFGGVCFNCGQLGMNNSTGDYCHACGKYKCLEKCGCVTGQRIHRHIQ